MVRFVTTSYSHMYDNDYMGLPESDATVLDPGKKHRRERDYTYVGYRVEQWRIYSRQKEADLCKHAGIDMQTYQDFLHGSVRLSKGEIRAIANALGTSVHNMTHYMPGNVPDDAAGGKKGSQTTSRTRTAGEPLGIKRASKQGTQPLAPLQRAQKAPEPYDREKALEALKKKFGDRVKREKGK